MNEWMDEWALEIGQPSLPPLGMTPFSEHSLQPLNLQHPLSPSSPPHVQSVASPPGSQRRWKQELSQPTAPNLEAPFHQGRHPPSSRCVKPVAAFWTLTLGASAGNTHHHESLLSQILSLSLLSAPSSHPPGNDAHIPPPRKPSLQPTSPRSRSASGLRSSARRRFTSLSLSICLLCPLVPREHPC